MPILAVEKPLREKLGDEAVSSLVKLLNQSQAEQKEAVIEFVEEKFERRLTEEISNLKVVLLQNSIEQEKRLSKKMEEGDDKLSQKISDLDDKLSQKISDLDDKLSQKIFNFENKISENNAQQIKWMFIFWVGQVVAILGILFAFFK